jgi:hypothetical protein
LISALIIFLVGGFELLFFIIPMLLIKIYQILPKDVRDLRIKQSLFAITVVFLIIGFAYLGYSDGVSTKKYHSVKSIELKEDGLLYNTNSDSLNFVGETNEYIFLYNKKNRETMVFNKSTITNLKIKDLSETDQEKERKYKKQHKALNSFFEKLKNNN